MQLKRRGSDAVCGHLLRAAAPPCTSTRRHSPAASPWQATLSERGIRSLERGFLPTLEKLGKRVQLLLGPEDVHLMQGPSETDGLQVTARLVNVSRPGRLRVGTGRCPPSSLPLRMRGQAPLAAFSRLHGVQQPVCFASPALLWCLF